MTYYSYAIKRTIMIILALCITIFSNFSAIAKDAIPQPPSINSKAHILLDYDSGQVLAASNPDLRLEPASLTKILAVDVVFKEIVAGRVKLSDKVLISKHAKKTGGSRTFIEVGEYLKVETLLKGAIIQSGNDATVALAEHIGGTEQNFAQMMNDQARNLSMTNSNFANATGLPHPDHYSTARDMAKVSIATIREFPEFYKIYSQKEFTFNKIKQRNRNLLLWRDRSIDGIKTGHTNAAGYCLAASAKRRGRRLVSVILGSKNEATRARDSKRLLDYGFKYFETHKLYEPRQVLGKVRVWKGVNGEVTVGPAHPVYVTVPKQQYQNIQLKLEMAASLPAPVAANQQVGRVLINLGTQQLAEVPLIALAESKTGNIFRQILDTILLWFN
ncbi:D-alanyl-D-alanine carboxypeptidase [Achromatium sp. WMS3]|nr:D-alanyl-D-alanine carboxypeptidase [Achromatium sp. WMS3]